MSAYRTYEVLYNDPNLIQEALKMLGISGPLLEGPTNLTGFQGDTRKDVSHLTVRRAHLSHASNDLGFTKEGKGYHLIVSEYDESYLCGEKTGISCRFSTAFKQAYALSRVQKNARKARRAISTPQNPVWGKAIQITVS